ncbi:hypothetical protein [Streptomyces chartreusis]|uniref:Uncharacterized protein n=1 Tax=Streptomyces chartreusis TaxID=1969 RepID=A0A7H8TA31_STRCX|nr:hypothetical protein [Streptomyces chartreusis]QKZ20277.1 hypothetical protein HUT05_24750 [Streptomyces chartreusis]
MPGKVICEICDEERVAADEEGVCALCHDENAHDTAAELRAAGIDPEDPPVVMAAECARRIFR